jgi:bacillithiol biosynthesis cysteine-adding enzyme BshC
MAESVFAALLSGRPEALRLLPGRFADPEAWRSAAEVAATRAVAGPLLEELARQSAGLPRCEARERNLELLGRAGTSVIVTGQQVGLFGGPLYTLHKAATAIARARMVTELSGLACVPLFWLQTEDHDYAEIAQVTVGAPSGPVTLALPADPEPCRIAVAHRCVPDEVTALLDRMADALAPLPHAGAVLEVLRAHYVPGRPLALAFAGLLAELWRGHGLVILDPRGPAVAHLAAPLMKRALDEHEAIAADLSARAEMIAKAGCSEQVHTRADASLVFFHPEGSTGPRYRLVRRGQAWETPAGPVSRQTLDDLLVQDPLRFSSSALLRPLLQDALLPTCAYVGGPAELAYFAQLPPVYARLGVLMPLIAPRARLRVIDGTTRSLLGRLGLTAADVDLPRAALLARVAADTNASRDVQALRARLLGALEQELGALSALGFEQLADPIRRTRDTCAAALNKLADKVEQAALERDHVACERIDRVIAALRPEGEPQERAYGFAALAARAGTDALLRAILEGAAPLDPGVRDVYP